jgi:hypothetical protein
MDTITIPDAEVKAFAKGGASIFQGKLSDFPEHIIAACAAYAIHKKAQDASGGKDLSGAAAKAAGLEVINSLKAGTWAKRGGGARIADLAAYLRREAAKIAKKRTEDKEDRYFGKDAAKLAEVYLTSDGAAKWREAREAEWQVILAERAKKAEAKDEDLGDLDLDV